MVVGNSNIIPKTLFDPAQTMSSIVANEFGEARAPFHLQSLIAIVLLLMVNALILNGVARLLVRGVTRNSLDVDVA
jgi:phosphate transport system permease protein